MTQNECSTSTRTPALRHSSCLSNVPTRRFSSSVRRLRRLMSVIALTRALRLGNGLFGDNGVLTPGTVSADPFAFGFVFLFAHAFVTMLSRVAALLVRITCCPSCHRSVLMIPSPYGQNQNRDFYFELQILRTSSMPCPRDIKSLAYYLRHSYCELFPLFRRSIGAFCQIISTSSRLPNFACRCAVSAAARAEARRVANRLAGADRRSGRATGRGRGAGRGPVRRPRPGQLASGIERATESISSRQSHFECQLTRLAF